MADRLLLAQIQLLRSALDGKLRAESSPAGTSGELPWKPGERVTATVEATRPGERMLLRVGNHVFDAPAFPSAATGQKLDLLFVSASPRATFALPAAVSPLPEALDAPRQVDISGAARRLESVLGSLAGENALRTQAGKVLQPLISAAPLDTRTLAIALQENVTRSGIFYESHLEHWVEGRIPLERIRQEPQGQLSLPARNDERADEAATPVGKGTAQSEAVRTSPLAPSADRSESVHPAAMPQVRAQLEALQSGQVAWQGLAWPGQDLQLEIEEDLHPDLAENERVWTSRLRITLPRLGQVDAVLLLSGPHLRVRLSAPSEDAAAELMQAQARLAEQFADARLHLVELDVDVAS